MEPHWVLHLFNAISSNPTGGTFELKTDPTCAKECDGSVVEINQSPAGYKRHGLVCAESALSFPDVTKLETEVSVNPAVIDFYGLSGADPDFSADLKMNGQYWLVCRKWAKLDSDQGYIYNSVLHQLAVEPINWASNGDENFLRVKAYYGFSMGWEGNKTARVSLKKGADFTNNSVTHNAFAIGDARKPPQGKFDPPGLGTAGSNTNVFMNSVLRIPAG